jgi:HEAT repeat protein
MPGVGTPWGGPPDTPNPLDDPYTFEGSEKVSDITAWQIWWAFNQEPYLRIINTGERITGSDNFYLGHGQIDVLSRGGRASIKTAEDEIVPQLHKVVTDGDQDYNTFNAALRSMGRIGTRTDKVQLSPALEYVLTQHELAPVKQNAALTFGILGRDTDYVTLRDYALGNLTAREKVQVGQFDDGVRAYAVYGLGLMGHHAGDTSLRAQIVRDLVDVLESDSTEDLKTASVVALSLVPLDVVEDCFACYCGTCHVKGPENSLQEQVTYLMRYFTDQKDFGPVLRAHAATAMARLVSARADTAPEDLKHGVAALLLAALEKRSGQPVTVRESCALALGNLGDADNDNVDAWIRWGLRNAAANGGPLEKRFAMISMGLVGSRAGTGDDPYASTKAVRADLLHFLSRGKNDVKPWAGLGLGVMGHWLAAAGQQPDSTVDTALRNLMKRAKRVDDLGAFALASGMRRDTQAVALLTDKLVKSKDAGARSYVALGLGLIGERSAIEPLQAVLDSEKTPAVLEARTGLALGLLADSTIAERLIARFDELEDENIAGRKAIVDALGNIGDQRSIETLSTVLHDDEQDNAVRLAAALALGRLGDNALLSWRDSIGRGLNYNAATGSLTDPAGSGVLDIH